MASELVEAAAPVTRRVRAYFAPVNRISAQPTLWDPAGIAGFDPLLPPAPWIDLGWCRNFVRTSATRIPVITTGAPAVALVQVRTAIEATVSLEFESWGKLPLALTAGVQQMNVLRTQPNVAANGSGGVAVSAVALGTGSSASVLDAGIAAAGFTVGEVIAIDVDYSGQTSFVGSRVSGGYVKSAAAIGSDVDYIRRITLNVGRIVAISGNLLMLGAPLLAGQPVAGMKVSHVAGFCDREGGTFFQEWSALFVVDGEQGDRIVFHYPRLQACAGPVERAENLTTAKFGSLERMRLGGSFRALPVRDANDGEQIVCFLSYLPGPMRAV